MERSEMRGYPIRGAAGPALRFAQPNPGLPGFGQSMRVAEVGNIRLRLRATDRKRSAPVGWATAPSPLPTEPSTISHGVHDGSRVVGTLRFAHPTKKRSHVQHPPICVEHRFLHHLGER